MKLPKLKAPKIKMPKPPKAIRHGLKEAGKAAHRIPADKVAIHALGHLAGHVLEQLVTDLRHRPVQLRCVSCLIHGRDQPLAFRLILRFEGLLLLRLGIASVEHTVRSLVEAVPAFHSS